MSHDYSQIKGINIEFRQHALAEYRHAHYKLNTEYSTVITDIDDLFVANANIPNLVATKLVQSMDLPSDEDKAKVKQMLNNGAMTLRWHLHNQDAFMRLTNSDIAFQDAIDANKFLQLAININGLHFKDNFRPNTFAEISTDPFTAAPTTPVAPTNPNLGTPVTLMDLANMIAQVSPNTTNNNNRTSPLGGNQTQQTGHIINPTSLPVEVRLRLEKGDEHDTYLTKRERCSFNSTVPNLIVDPAGNTMRKMFYFMDGPHRMITRSGDLFYFSKWDEKKQKMFISRSPKPASKVHDAITIRDWYYKFHGHAQQYGIYVHNYFDFRKLSGDPKGFTCGEDTDDTLYDVPRLLEPRLREWDSTIHAALQDIFSTAGTNEYKVIQNKHGRGYEALFDIIRPNHPEHDTYPSLLIKDRPMQRE